MSEKIAQGLVSQFGSVDQFIESEDQIEQLSDPNKVTFQTSILQLRCHFPGSDSERFDHGSADPDKGEETLGKGETGRKSPSWQSLRRQGLSQV